MIRHGGVVMRDPSPRDPSPITTVNFQPAPLLPPEDGTVKPVSFLPVFFGAGLALIFILNAKNSVGNGLGNYTFNFR